MATTVPDLHAASGAIVSADYIERLESLARKHGWTLDEAMKRALDISEVVLDANSDPDSKVYIYRGSRRYALSVKP